MFLKQAATEATTTAAVPVEVPEEVEPMNLEEPIDDQHFGLFISHLSN